MSASKDGWLLVAAVGMTAGLAFSGAGWNLGEAPAVVEVASMPRQARAARDEGGDLSHPPTIAEDAWRLSESGLQVVDRVVGDGPTLAPGFTITLDYAMWSAAGELLDESWGRPDSYQFVAGAHQVIPGWEAALQGVRVGGRRVAKIPAALGFGHAGTKGVPPDTDLILELRLVAVTAARVEPQRATLSGMGPLPGTDLIGVDVVTGTGPMPLAGGNVLVDMITMREDGTAISSTWSRSKSAVFALDTMPPPLPQAFAGMHVGGRRIVRVPAELVPGLGTLGKDVPPGETLVLDLTLQGIPAN